MRFGFELELFAADEKGLTIPAHKFDFLPQAESPELLTEADGVKAPGRVYRDGWAIEMSTVRPDTTIGVMYQRGKQLIAEAERRLPNGVYLSTAPAMRIDIKELDDAPCDLRQFGCKPSWNAYREQEEGVHVDPLTHPWRTTGCHIHFSASDPTEESLFEAVNWHSIVKLLDMYVALPLTYLFPSPELARRRELYGLAGDYRRPGRHHIEYRVLSSEVWCHPIITKLTYTMVRDVVLHSSQLLKGWKKKEEDALQKAINEVDEDAAERFLPRVKDFWNYTPEVMAQVGNFDKLDKLVQTGKIDSTNTILDHDPLYPIA